MKTLILSLITIVTLISCGSKEPVPIKLNVDACEFCKMTISNGKFGAELITKKGRHYKFDDVACMIQFAKSSTIVSYESFYVNDYLKDNTLIPAETAHFIKGEKINSPMRGNLAAFTSTEKQTEFGKKLEAQSMNWSEVYNAYK
ncbi:nitrous oxide reductase accessory protein NosL [Flavobacterium capsici]|uniref:Nitrous oxide reductase accessory protein NosL n=1 Tax=Flavobacterium capsici TaxID=3075618 RepID=A0AA96EU35_9FLAO|nr:MULTISPECIES: nitrous oxide reductase accessory protein NosL [unclassified Flavobacterium]WNM18498.1 nitrous oxide reductase accessory protein NosL [Flavobacterium sp. PMR2A8]WNM22549.1 nitrous oxide reductase accessory protein NosL [Flavobacterium sp. PMTSA4]